MANISLESAIRTCKVNPAYSERAYSNRFLDPNEASCPIWNGRDSLGREVCPDSFMTKSGGCNSAMDRVVVENNQRPQYAEYINLSTGGIDGKIYGDTSAWKNSGGRSAAISNANNITGNFGLNLGDHIYPSCSYNSYKNGMAGGSTQGREEQRVKNGANAAQRRARSGN